MTEPLSIYIHTHIGYRGIRGIGILNTLRGMPNAELQVHFDSEGGEVFEGMLIYNEIKNHKAKTISYIDHIAGGVSSIIAMAADEIVMDSEAFIMMCNPHHIGKEDDIQANNRTCKITEKIAKSFAEIYAGRSNRTESQILTMMEAETFLTADEAYGFGFIDRIE